MRNLPTITAFILLLLAGNIAKAQTEDSSVVVRIAPVPPLGDLIDSALKFNASVKAGHDRVHMKEHNVITYRDNWTRNLGLQADTRYGTFDNFSTSVNGPSTALVSSTSKQFNWGVGFYIKMPIFDLIGRKNQIDLATAELAEATHLAEAQADLIRQTVIRQYHDLLLKQKVLNIRAANLSNARVNMLMVEKQFRNGVVAVTEFVRLSDIVARIGTDFESAKTDYLSSRMILEDLVGFNFDQTDKAVVQ